MCFSNKKTQRSINTRTLRWKLIVFWPQEVFSPVPSKVIPIFFYTKVHYFQNKNYF